MYKIKQIPEDFIVKEITNVKAQSNGVYSYFWLKKRDYTTVRAVENVAERLRIPMKNIGFAGSKDKRAVTEQLISIKNCGVKELKLKDIGLKYFGKGDKPISLGDLEGNSFVITVRGIENRKIKEGINDIKIPNYFDEQRFSRNNAEVGKAIVKKDFKRAVEFILENKGDFEGDVKDYLRENPSDYIGGLRRINKKLLKLYVHSYQSKIFNETVDQYLKINERKNTNTKNTIKNEINKKIKSNKIPIVGFGTEIEDKEIKRIIDRILEKEKINLRDFIISQVPELSSEGTERELFIDVKDFKMTKEKDKVILSFTLPKGAYATIVVKALFER